MTFSSVVIVSRTSCLFCPGRLQSSNNAQNTRDAEPRQPGRGMREGTTRRRGRRNASRAGRRRACRRRLGARGSSPQDSGRRVARGPGQRGPIGVVDGLVRGPEALGLVRDGGSLGLEGRRERGRRGAGLADEGLGLGDEVRGDALAVSGDGGARANGAVDDGVDVVGDGVVLGLGRGQSRGGQEESGGEEFELHGGWLVD